MKVFNSGGTETKNQSSIREFMLIGLTDSCELKALLFWPFLCTYITGVIGNVVLIFLICSSKRLHTPMYFLLVNLSLVNVLSITTTIPKLLQTLWTCKSTISFYGCISQVYFFIWLLSTELTLLTSMAFDRYAAICHPLQYTIIMRKEVCVGIATGAWVIGLMNSIILCGSMLSLSFCQANMIDHFICDLLPLLKLSCSDISLNKTMVSVADFFFGIVSCGLTLTSYGFILRAIFKIKSAEGKKKAFSTCSSHLFVVSFYFSSVIYSYMKPTSGPSVHNDKYITLLYIVVTPVLNPFIYSLRNKEVKEALKLLFGRGKLFQRHQD